MSAGKRKESGKSKVDDPDDDIFTSASGRFADTSDFSGAEGTTGKGKRLKSLPKSVVRRSRSRSPRSSRNKGSSVEKMQDEEVEVAVMPGSAYAESALPSKKSKNKKKLNSGDSIDESIAQMKKITLQLNDVVAADSVTKADARLIMQHVSSFESLLIKFIAENGRLRERLDVLSSRSLSVAPVANVVVPSSVPMASDRAMEQLPVVPKPVETWSVVVKGKKGVTSEEVVQKVEKEVGPTLGVRVHAIRPMKDGGAVIRTPSVAEREKIAANEKFAEVGLEVSVKDKMGPRVVVQGVHAEISTDEFMSELYEMNFKCDMELEEFKKCVRLVSSPWKSNSDGKLNVVLEVTEKLLEFLVTNGVYIKWFRFNARPQDVVRTCYRCLSFDHEVRNCKFTAGVCRQCGLTGHLASRCQNPVKCRNCELKGFPAGHSMMSPACPIIAAKIASVNSRH